MIRTFIKLVIVVVVLNAMYNAGDVYWDHYRFQDSVQELAQFAEQASMEDIRAKVIDLAAAQDIPLDPSDVTVTHDNHKTVVDAAYVRDVTIFPRYTRPWAFKIHVVVITLN
jgi:hypothetical protein